MSIRFAKHTHHTHTHAARTPPERTFSEQRNTKRSKALIAFPHTLCFRYEKFVESVMAMAKKPAKTSTAEEPTLDGGVPLMA